MSPSKVKLVCWEDSFNDIETRTSLKVNEYQSLIVQDHQTLTAIIGQVLGGPSSEVNSSPEPEGFKPKNELEMKMAFNSVFGNGGR